MKRWAAAEACLQRSSRRSGVASRSSGTPRRSRAAAAAVARASEAVQHCSAAAAAAPAAPPAPPAPPAAAPPAPGAGGAAAATTWLLAVPVSVLLADAQPAHAATVCIDVPDWLADWRSTLLHSPVAAVGVATLGLILFPKLVRTAINYLAIPAVVAMLAFAAVQFPETTADSVYGVLEFVREHPTAASVAVIAAGGILLGPDLLAGVTISAGVLLLAVKLGFVQMPALPPAQLPRGGGAFLSRQLDKTAAALRERLDEADADGDDAGQRRRP